MTDDLFSRLEDELAEYPHRPGWTREATAAEAAAFIAPKAPALRAKCLAAIRAAPRGLTGNELAEKLGWDITSVRPRLTELARLEKIMKHGRRPTPSGCSAIVWVPITALKVAA